MKQLILSLSVLLAAGTSFAQTALEQFEAQLPDSVVYVSAEFRPGRVVYKNGEYSNGVFNIATIDQTLRFKNDDGTVFALNNNREVDRVSIGGALYLHLGDDYAKLEGMDGDVLLCSIKKIQFKKDAKKGAFGMISETTSISSVSSLSDELGSTYNLSSTAEYRLTDTPVLVRKNRQYAFSKKSLEKLFPAKKEFIASYLKEHDVDFDNTEDALALFAALK